MAQFRDRKAAYDLGSASFYHSRQNDTLGRDTPPTYCWGLVLLYGAVPWISRGRLAMRLRDSSKNYHE